ncbi:MAG TPA: hypothetical protein VM099_00900 [Gemmatimonadaceae bacterium]|nr:hypothetical protein [Gemmatimonadaceae bacterium]
MKRIVIGTLPIIFFASTMQSQNVLEARVGMRGDSSYHGPSLLTATLASAIIPGAGQTLLGSRRAIIYSAAEVVGLVAYASQQRKGDRERDRYLELARGVARSRFSPDGPVGNWDYHERMEKFAASGAFDVVPGGPLEPEPDETTYNGSVWLLARQTYWRDPKDPPATSSAEYEAAISFYKNRAVSDDMRWSWLGTGDGLQQYQRAIARSNSAFKRAEQTLGLVIANHFLSAIDAFVSVKMRARNEPDGRVTLIATLPFGISH